MTPDEPIEPNILRDTKIRRMVLTIGWMIIAGGAVFALSIAWPAIQMLIRTTLPFVVALVIAYVFNPIVSFVQNRLRLSRIGGILLLYALLFAAVAGFFAILLPIIWEQAGNAWRGISEFISNRIGQNARLKTAILDINQWLTDNGIDVKSFLAGLSTSSGVGTAASTAASSGAKLIGNTFEILFHLIGTTISYITFFVLIFLVSIYLLLDFNKARTMMEVIIPTRHQERTFAVLGRMDVAVGGFMRGMLITSFLVGLMTFTGLWILGLKEYALLIGIIGGLANLIPYCGPIAGGGPAILYVIFSEAVPQDKKLLMVGGVLVVQIIIQFTEGFVFQPFIVGKSAQLHPLVVLFALALGANFGLPGMIVAVPIACIVRVLVNEFYWDPREKEWRERSISTLKKVVAKRGPGKTDVATEAT